MNSYVLESAEEFDRLEKQSQNKAYDYEAELKGFSPKETGAILDAGCGSGIVTRHLANRYPSAQLVGCDFSDQRVEQAKHYIHSTENRFSSNISFETQNLTQLNFKPSSFDGIVCRYVLEHMSNENAQQTLNEFYRCMRPNGKLRVIDVDGLVYNLFPRTNFLEEAFTQIQKLNGMDFNIGRKIPELAAAAGFDHIQWEIETLQFRGDDLTNEMQLIKERFELAFPTLTHVLGSEQKANQFIDEYFSCLKKPGAVLFYNKFIVTGEKSGFKIQR